MKYLAILLCILLSFNVEAASVKDPENYVYRIFRHNVDGVMFNGTGFKMRYKNKTYIISAEHVCNDIHSQAKFKPLIVTDNIHLSSNVTSMSYNFDLCVLEVPELLDRDGKALELASKPAVNGDKLTIIGFPGGKFKIMASTRHVGKIKMKLPATQEKYPYHNKMIDTADYVAIPGQSGGPVLNAKNEVVGVVIYKYFLLTAYVPFENLKTFLDYQK